MTHPVPTAVLVLERAALSALLAGACVAQSASAGSPAAIELVESAPIETSLDHADIPEAHQVWLDMIGGAKQTLDIAEFYVSNQPNSRLEPVIAAIETAAARGVHVRLLADAKFAKTYPETLDRLAARKGVEVRRIDYGGLAGGILHAKYFAVDGREAYIGSQNFDWRSLEHIQELGVRVRDAGLTRAVEDLYETDWALAGGGEKSARAAAPSAGYGFPRETGAGADELEYRLVASPKGWLSDESTWELPQLVALIDAAKQNVHVQLLTYKSASRDGGYWDELESALRRAAGRGVEVELLLSDWCKRKGTIEGLQSLEVLPHVDVKLVTLPAWSGGFVPYGRTIHAKYVVVDGQSAWIGTSNWEQDYFYKSRNLGLIVKGASFAGQLERFFQSGWSATYAAAIDPCAHYEPPQIGEEAPKRSGGAAAGEAGGVKR